MTRDELKETIDKWLGMESILVANRYDDCELIYFSPTGIKLFDVTISYYAGSWQAGSKGSAIPEYADWKTLIHIHERGN